MQDWWAENYDTLFSWLFLLAHTCLIIALLAEVVMTHPKIKAALIRRFQASKHRLYFTSLTTCNEDTFKLYFRNVTYAVAGLGCGFLSAIIWLQNAWYVIPFSNFYTPPLAYRFLFEIVILLLPYIAAVLFYRFREVPFEYLGVAITIIYAYDPNAMLPSLFRKMFSLPVMVLGALFELVSTIFAKTGAFLTNHLYIKRFVLMSLLCALAVQAYLTKDQLNPSKFLFEIMTPYPAGPFAFALVFFLALLPTGASHASTAAFAILVASFLAGKTQLDLALLHFKDAIVCDAECLTKFACNS